MEENELLTRMERVEAPPGFEQRVMAQLGLRKQRRRKVRRLTLTLSTATAALVVVFVAVNFLVLAPGSPGRMAGLEKDISPDFSADSRSASRIHTIPITEALDFSGEIRQVTHEPRTIYILEQVSDRTDTRIIY